ncbi:unnamed protein product, partial [Polarella glacialis]
ALLRVQLLAKEVIMQSVLKAVFFVQDLALAAAAANSVAETATWEELQDEGLDPYQPEDELDQLGVAEGMEDLLFQDQYLEQEGCEQDILLIEDNMFCADELPQEEDFGYSLGEVEEPLGAEDSEDLAKSAKAPGPPSVPSAKAASKR